MSKLTLTTSDGTTFDVSEAAAAKFGAIRRMVEDGCTKSDKRIAVPMVDGKIFAMMVVWSEKHADNNAKAAEEAELKDWDAEFVKDMDQGVLYHLLMGADFLDAAELVDLLIGKVASMVKGKKAEEIRQIFHIENDFTPEQEAEIRNKNAWAFE